MPDANKCIFCEIIPTNRVIDQGKKCLVIRDAFPVTKGHTLIIPKRHVSDYFDTTEDEKAEIQNLLMKHRSLLLHCDETIKGFNIGINVGEVSGQTVFHVHVHLIPRRLGDVQNPRGGVRGVIPEKQKY